MGWKDEGEGAGEEGGSCVQRLLGLWLRVRFGSGFAGAAAQARDESCDGGWAV